ncbi:hypothetical protein GCM10025771_13340 [Niveibacterium umoris]|uniref:SnoaL-like domain-containing protein n=1 Tax=Niveibacterium umoris TaxID=1193620 RepID=A0A840BJF1_9RHOO|nr:nuclear transport factor 2 family protein [Niveibacterium umoris]MBB4013110.1 hypothetical protein [Niveibacterium umoris]
MNPNLDLLRDFFAAINRNDMDAMAACFAPGVVRTEPEGWDTAGTHIGVEAVRANVSKGRATWAEGSCDPEKYLVGAERIVVYLHARVRLASSNEWVGGRFADGFVLADGKILEYRTFWERRDALAWAGITDEETE